MQKKRLLEFIKLLSSMIAMVIIGALIGTLLLTAVYMIPTEHIEKNVGFSAQTLNQEGLYPKLSKWCTSKVDNYTDSIMLSESAYDSDESAVIKAMKASRMVVNEDREYEPYDSIVDHYVRGIEYTKEVTYERYWHGYLIFLKPLLLLTNYRMIRGINFVVQLILSIIIICLLYKNKLKELIIPYIITIGFLMPVVLAKSIQYSTCYYVILLTVIFLIIKKNELHKTAIYFFVWAGIATAFFDFLTYPIATFGIPAVVYFYMLEKSKTQGKFFELIKILIAWGIGYAGMWISKWIIGSVITGENILLQGLNRFLLRTSNQVDDWAILGSFPQLRSVVMNILFFIKTPVTIVAFVFFFILCVMIVKRCKTEKINLSLIIDSVEPFLMIGLLPFVWYVLTANHSSYHSFFTNKALSVTAFAFMTMVVKIYCDIEKQRQK